MAQLFADEDFPWPAVAVLRGLGHDVLTTREAGLASVKTPDAVILAEATRLGRAVLTMNRRHYIALHTVGHIGAGDRRIRKHNRNRWPKVVSKTIGHFSQRIARALIVSQGIEPMIGGAQPVLAFGIIGLAKLGSSAGQINARILRQHDARGRLRN